MNRSMPGLPVHHQLQESTQIHGHWVDDAIQPSHPLWSPSPPALNLSPHQGLFQWVSSLHQVAKVLEFQLQHQSFQWTPRTDLLLYEDFILNKLIQTFNFFLFIFWQKSQSKYRRPSVAAVSPEALSSLPLILGWGVPPIEFLYPLSWLWGGLGRCQQAPISSGCTWGQLIGSLSWRFEAGTKMVRAFILWNPPLWGFLGLLCPSTAGLAFSQGSFLCDLPIKTHKALRWQSLYCCCLGQDPELGLHFSLYPNHTMVISSFINKHSTVYPLLVCGSSKAHTL